MLQVEIVARDAAREGIALVQALPRGNGELVDQVKRALISVVLNTTEGLNRTAGDRRNLLTVARGSAAEAGAALGLLAALGLADQTQVDALDERLDRVRGMLFKLAQRG